MINLKKTGWWARNYGMKILLNSRGRLLVYIKSDFDLQLGKASAVMLLTYVNTRALNFRGGLGDKLNFSTTVFESQGRFADYFNRYAESIKPAGGNPQLFLV
jgi:hypothetical protein